MKRSITRWTTTLAMAAVLGVPAVGVAQSPSTTPPRESPQPPTGQPSPEPPARTPPLRPSPEPPTQPTPQPAAEPPMTQPPAGPSPTTEPTTSERRGSATTAPSTTSDASPDEHLRQAKAALDAIPAASLTGRARTQVAELKRHMAALSRGSAPATTATTTPQTPTATAPAKAPANASGNWGTEVAAMDKVLGELLGTGTGASNTATPGATGTAGTAGAAGTSGVTMKPDTLDEATRSRLTEVRTHITAYAAARAASSSTAPKGADAASTASPGPSGPGAAPAQSTEAPAAPANDSAGAQSSAAAAAPASDAGANPAAPAAAQPSDNQADAEAARQALTTARDTLSQLTQLPAAAQLSGEARTQVAQLISNFNELITAQVQWRASYGKVAANLAALIGPEGTDPAAIANAAPGTATGSSESSTPGAVGTSGTTTIQVDPAIRAKLIELRRNLTDFEKASGGAAK